MRLEQLSASESLQILYDIDRGVLTPECVNINGSLESRICFKGTRMEVIQSKGKKTGVALFGKTGGVLVRRGHATNKRHVMNLSQSLNFYWITDEGRMAAQSTSQAT